MKVVIIGGGIAGLTLGVLLRKKNFEVVLNERHESIPFSGHAFLLHADGLNILRDLDPACNLPLPGKLLKDFKLKRPSGTKIKHILLDSWQCIKRRDLMEFLYNLFPNALIKGGRNFSHFIYDEDKIVAAAFLNGDIEYGDIFVGADGGNSRVREALFGKVKLSTVEVKEIVGVSYNEELAKTHFDTFTKFQDNTRGLSFGMIPSSKNEFVWFMQYDPSANELTDSTPEELGLFCKSLLKNFPPEVSKLLSTNNFCSSYIWNTRDFDLLPAFHHQNVVLIGDAAHLSLPFTSSGTSNAIVDAKTLADKLTLTCDHELVFESYFKVRSKEIARHIQLGRDLKTRFLNPQNFNDDDILLPLIDKKVSEELTESRKPIQVLYFTDPICSTCWIIQPFLRKLKLEYGKYVNIKYCMGGLLPSWDEYSKGKISNPSDASRLWDEACSIHGMPLDGDIWLEDPLHSSYPPSIAFKAAQMQDNYLAILFLRRIMEMVFIEKKNIIKWEYLENAALEVGLDSARLLRDFEGGAKTLFSEDLSMGKVLGVTSFPTLIFSDQSSNSITLKGLQSYEKLEEVIINMIPKAKKEVINTKPEKLFNLYPTMTLKEFALLSNVSTFEATFILNDLYSQGYIKKYDSKSGMLYKNNFKEKMKLPVEVA